MAAMRERQQQNFELDVRRRGVAGRRRRRRRRFPRQRRTAASSIAARLASLQSDVNDSPLSSRPNSAQTRVPASRKRKLVDEVGRQHESVAERMADRGRIDVAALRRRAVRRAARSQ